MDARAATRRVRRKRTAKSCGSGAAVLALSPGEAKLLADDGGKRAVLRGEHEVSRKAIAQGRPECSRCPVCSCAVLFAQIARETAGAASTRSSLRPLFRRGQAKMQTSGAMRRENAKSYPASWHEWSEAIPIVHTHRALMGIASLHPSYGMHDAEREAAERPSRRARRPAGNHLRGMEPGPRAPVTARPASISGSRISLW